MTPWRSAIIATLAGTTLTACTTSQPYLRILESTGDVRIDATRRVAIRLRHPHSEHRRYKLEIPAQRQELALEIIKPQCPAGTVISEDVVDTGEYLLGRPSRLFVLNVSC